MSLIVICHPQIRHTLNKKMQKMQLLKCHTIFDHDHYRCIISIINKNEAINLLQNADLTEKSER